MSANDLWIRDTFSIYGYVLFGFIVFYCIVKWKWAKLVAAIYRSHLLGFEAYCTYLAEPYKKRLFASLYDLSSSDEILRQNECIRIVEIGVKTGENIQYYPDGTHFIGVDWNQRLKEYLTRSDRAWQFSHIVIERLIIGDGACLKGIPNNYVDAVITVRSLCSTTSLQQTLSEIRRVLAPGGKYIFFEHVPDKSGTWTRFFQKLLMQVKIWPELFGGCRLDCNPMREIKTAGFEEVVWESISLTGSISHPYKLQLTRRHVLGMAIK